MDILNTILDAVSVGLTGLFPGIPVYAEYIPSEMPPRWFLIGFAGETHVSPGLTGIYRVSGKLDITYFPPQMQDEVEHRREMLSVFSTLALGLRVVDHGNVRLRLTGHSLTEADGLLHNLCGFSLMLYETDTTPLMGDIRVDKEEIK